MPDHRVCAHHRIAQKGKSECTLTVNLKVHFVKSLMGMIKKQIRSETIKVRPMDAPECPIPNEATLAVLWRGAHICDRGMISALTDRLALRAIPRSRVSDNEEKVRYASRGHQRALPAQES